MTRSSRALAFILSAGLPLSAPAAVITFEEGFSDEYRFVGYDDLAQAPYAPGESFGSREPGLRAATPEDSLALVTLGIQIDRFDGGDFVPESLVAANELCEAGFCTGNSVRLQGLQNDTLLFDEEFPFFDFDTGADLGKLFIDLDWGPVDTFRIFSGAVEIMSLDNIALTEVEVPEPASLALLGLSLPLVGLMRRRRPV